MKTTTLKYVHNRKKNETIELRVSFDRNTHAYISTKIKVPEKYWDTEQEMVKRPYPDAENINAKLWQMKADYTQVVADCEAQGVLNKGELAKIIKEHFKGKNPVSIQSGENTYTAVKMNIRYYSTITCGTLV